MALPLNRVCKHVDSLMHLLGECRGGKVDDQLDGIVQQVYRISSLVYNLVALSKHTAPAFVDVNIGEVILDAIENCEQERGRAVVLNLYLKETLPAVSADPLLLTSVFQNVFFVADELAGEDGVPRLTTTFCPESMRVKVVIETSGAVANIDESQRTTGLLPGENSLSPGGLLRLNISKKLLNVQHGHLTLSANAQQNSNLEIALPVTSFYSDFQK